jgi:uncharacterized protein (DUF58 family)
VIPPFNVLFERETMKRTVLGCLAVALLIVAAGTVFVWFWLFRALPVLDASLSLPREVALESTVPLVITVTNPHEKSVTLDSIDIADSLLSGFQVVSIEPDPTETYHIPIFDQRSWTFGESVMPGGTLSVTFHLRAVQAGHFSGDIDVCNPNQNCTTLLADVVVK